MTRLFIDGVAVTLNEDFEIEYNLENPFFTRNGEYTYDIDIDLRDSQNRALYRHIDRSEASDFPKNREAVVICDGETIIRGTEVILSVDNYIAKIQIVSGNSELNYISKGDLNIRELDFGEFAVNVDTATASTQGCFPEHNWVCTPISVDNSNTKENSKWLNNPNIALTGWYYDSLSDLVAQPYALFVIEKLMSILGYTIEVNELRKDERWCRLFIVNGFHTNIVAEMLPDWTVDEFIDEVEKFFNVIFQINPLKKSVRIISVDRFYDETDMVYIERVIDNACEKKIGVKSPLAITYDNVNYDFPSYEKYKYMRIDDKVMATLGEENRTHYYDYWDRLEQTITDKKILHCLDYGFDAVGHKYDNGLGLDIVNRFDNIIDAHSDNDTSLKIVPAEMRPAVSGMVLEALLPAGFFAVYARNSNPLDEEDGVEYGLHEIIKSGLPEKDATDRLFVALYAGVRRMFYINGEHDPYLEWDKPYDVPMSCTDNLQYFCAYWDIRPGAKWFSDLKILRGDKLTLRLTGEYGLYNSYYRYSMDVDTSVEFKFSFFADKLPDQRAIYVIRNQKYYCKSLTARILPEGRSQIIDGVFYKMA